MNETDTDRLWIVVFAICFGCLLCPLGVWYFADHNPYNTLIEAEDQAVPRFAELNEAVLRELPPPEGVVSIHQDGNQRIDTQHGIDLSVDYGDAEGKKIKGERIKEYYETLLTQEGWIKYSQFDKCGVSYYRNTSCILVSFPCDNDEGDFYISIWHDFEKQDFSPTLPPLWLVNLLENGETRILTCPPEGAVP